jgi:hypothetical protein
MPSSHHRLSIFSASEIDDLYGVPRFHVGDRDLFFQLIGPELAAVMAIRTVSATVHLILQLCYFKAKRQLFAYDREDTAENPGKSLRPENKVI